MAMQQVDMFVDAEDRRLFAGVKSLEFVIARLPSSPMLSPVDIATALDTKADTVYRWIDAGLFEYIDPNGAKAEELEANGYKKVEWASKMVSEKGTLWDYNMLSGIDLSDVPLYFHPIPRETLDQSKGNVTNGYGLPQV